MSASPKLCLLASPAKPVSIAPNQQPISQPIPAAVTAIQPKRLLRNAKPILDRVRELQAEANARQQSKIDLSRERVGRRLDKASRIAEEQGNASAMAASELGIAKVFHNVQEQEANTFDFKNATSMHDIGKKLLMSVGFESPDEASIELAIEANDAFVDRLEEIYAQARATIDE